jgi:ribosome-associated protein YbcJ (S4-like RNA binding protein)
VKIEALSRFARLSYQGTSEQLKAMIAEGRLVFQDETGAFLVRVPDEAALEQLLNILNMVDSGSDS